MQLTIQESVPTTLLESPNALDLQGSDGLMTFVVGPGAVTIYVRMDGIWRRHPVGQDISDNGAFARLVTGLRRYAGVQACAVAGTGVTEETQVFAEALRYG